MNSKRVIDYIDTNDDFLKTIAVIVFGSGLFLLICYFALPGDQPRIDRCARIDAEYIYARGAKLCKKPDGSIWAMPSD